MQHATIDSTSNLAPGTHYEFECEVCPTLPHKTCAGNRTPERNMPRIKQMVLGQNMTGVPFVLSDVLSACVSQGNRW